MAGMSDPSSPPSPSSSTHHSMADHHQKEKIDDLLLLTYHPTRRSAHRRSLEKLQPGGGPGTAGLELAELRLEEVQQGIAHRDSAAVKVELELTKDRVATAFADLQLVKEEAEALQEEHASMAVERDAVLTRAQKSTAASQEVERTIEDLIIELNTLKELPDSSPNVDLEDFTAASISALLESGPGSGFGAHHAEGPHRRVVGGREDRRAHHRRVPHCRAHHAEETAKLDVGEWETGNRTLGARAGFGSASKSRKSGSGRVEGREMGVGGWRREIRIEEEEDWGEEGSDMWGMPI